MTIDWACCCKLRPGVRCDARATVYVPVLDPVRFEKAALVIPETAEGIEPGVDQRGTWWCGKHAELAVEYLEKGPLAERQAAAWDLAVAQAKEEIAARDRARGERQEIAQLEERVQEDWHREN